MSSTTMTLQNVDPRTLLIQRNIRKGKPDQALVDSIRAVGVLEPITVVETPSGDLLVRYGERRTLAAIEAGQALVPVINRGQDGEDNVDEINRIITQRDENNCRQGLTAAEDVDSLAQMSAFGLSAEEISKTARAPRAQVDAALAVSVSKLASAVAERHADLTLDQLAAVAEFEQDPETVKGLMAAVPSGRFEHALQSARDKRDIDEAKTLLTADLEAKGIRVVPDPGWSGTGPTALERLKASAKSTAAFLPESHQDCPGHVAWLGIRWEIVIDGDENVELPQEPDEDADEETWEAYEAACEEHEGLRRNVQRPYVIYGCANPAGNGHVDRYGGSKSSKPKAAELSDEEREAAKAARRLVIDNNKAWASSTTVRQNWIKKWAGAKTEPQGTGRFLATALAKDCDVITGWGSRQLAASWLTSKKGDSFARPDLSPAKTTTEARCTVIALVQVIAGYEDSLMDNSWRNDGTNNACGRYLRFLASIGYTLSDVEEYAISSKTA